MTPARPTLADVRGALVWIVSPHEALECLQTHGLAPEDDVRREFVWRSRTEHGWDDWREEVTPHPSTLPDLIAWASLGIPAILRAEELARGTVARLRPWGCPQTERVVWRVGERRSVYGAAWVEGDGYATVRRSSRALHVDGLWVGVGDDVVIKPARDLWAMGLALDSITADAVTLVVPPTPGIAR